MDNLLTLMDIAKALRRHRTANKLAATVVARRAGRSRDILHRLERGEDITASALLDLLGASGLAVALVPTGTAANDELGSRLAALDGKASIPHDPEPAQPRGGET